VSAVFWSLLFLVLHRPLRSSPLLSLAFLLPPLDEVPLYPLFPSPVPRCCSCRSGIAIDIRREGQTELMRIHPARSPPTPLSPSPPSRPSHPRRNPSSSSSTSTKTAPPPPSYPCHLSHRRRARPRQARSRRVRARRQDAALTHERGARQERRQGRQSGQGYGRVYRRDAELGGSGVVAEPDGVADCTEGGYGCGGRAVGGRVWDAGDRS
jgi:hypothetical protein